MTPQALVMNGDTDCTESSLCLEEVASAKPPALWCHLWKVSQVLVFSGSGINPYGFAHQLLDTILNLVSEYGLRGQALI